MQVEDSRDNHKAFPDFPLWGFLSDNLVGSLLIYIFEQSLLKQFTGFT